MINANWEDMLAADAEQLLDLLERQIAQGSEQMMQTMDQLHCLSYYLHSKPEHAQLVAIFCYQMAPAVADRDLKAGLSAYQIAATFLPPGNVRAQAVQACRATLEKMAETDAHDACESAVLIKSVVDNDNPLFIEAATFLIEHGTEDKADVLLSLADDLPVFNTEQVDALIACTEKLESRDPYLATKVQRRTLDQGQALTQAQTARIVKSLEAAKDRPSVIVHLLREHGEDAAPKPRAEPQRSYVMAAAPGVH